MDTVQTLSSRISPSDLAFDAGLLNILRSPRRADSDILHETEILLCLARIGRQLTPNDILILEAVIAAGGNRSAAARTLAPGRPSYRRYISRRLEKLLSIVRNDLLRRA
jgi:hypothetical protein